ncbi:hypothetical protein ACJJTC_014500 [Scirpophaga incertulas]
MYPIFSISLLDPSPLSQPNPTKLSADKKSVVCGGSKRLKHTLKIKEGKVRQSRRFCIDCYKSCVSSFGSRIAKNKAKKVASYCFECPGQPHYCLECFNKCHRYF